MAANSPMLLPEPTVEGMRREGPTPNGGAYSIAYFRDDTGALVERERATQVEIHEFSASGESIHRTYARLDRRS